MVNLYQLPVSRTLASWSVVAKSQSRQQPPKPQLLKQTMQLPASWLRSEPSSREKRQRKQSSHKRLPLSKLLHKKRKSARSKKLMLLRRGAFRKSFARSERKKKKRSSSMSRAVNKSTFQPNQ